MRTALLILPLAAAGLVAARADRPAAVKAPAKPTYAHDVAPILNRACVDCHQPGEVAPFSLRGYDAAKKWSAMSATVTQSKQMPPWKAAPNYGDFQHENRLSDVEIQTLANWAATGAPRGDAKKEPVAPPAPTGGWRLGKPDLILKPKGTFHLEPEGNDVYRNFVVQNPSDHDLYVRGADVHPGNKAVVHHVFVVVDASHRGSKLAAKSTDGQDGYVNDGGGFGFVPQGAVAAWVPGYRAELAPDGYGVRVPAGADLVLQVHYHKSGKPEEDDTELGLYLQDKPLEHEYHFYYVAKLNLSVPAGEKAFPAETVFNVAQDVTIHGVIPHMHKLGQSMRAKAVTPDGREIPLVMVPKWDFNWQLAYMFKEPIHVPAGTKLVVDAVYDNSTGNPNNPHTPPKPVHWGEQTTDEMMLLGVAYTVDGKRQAAGDKGQGPKER